MIHDHTSRRITQNKSTPHRHLPHSLTLTFSRIHARTHSPQTPPHVRPRSSRRRRRRPCGRPGLRCWLRPRTPRRLRVVSVLYWVVHAPSAAAAATAATPTYYAGRELLKGWRKLDRGGPPGGRSSGGGRKRWSNRCELPPARAAATPAVALPRDKPVTVKHRWVFVRGNSENNAVSGMLQHQTQNTKTSLTSYPFLHLPTSKRGPGNHTRC